MPFLRCRRASEITALQSQNKKGTARGPFPTGAYAGQFAPRVLPGQNKKTSSTTQAGPHEFCSTTDKRNVRQFAPGCYPGVGRVTNGTFCVDFGGKPVVRSVLQLFRKCEFLDSGKPSLSIDINVFFKLNLYKVYGFQWTNRKNCCIIISFLCRGLNAVIYRKR